MRYDFLVETYETERVKVLSVWSEFHDEDMPVRPRQGDPRGRSVHEQMVHQCVSEDFWCRTMLGIVVAAPPLPAQEARLEFIKRYAEDSEKRLELFRAKQESWWEGETTFFDVQRSRSWVVTAQWHLRHSVRMFSRSHSPPPSTTGMIWSASHRLFLPGDPRRSPHSSRAFRRGAPRNRFRCLQAARQSTPH